MNIDHIYQLQRDEAFADQFSAKTYRTFVAMPFSNRGGYPEERIRILLKKVHTEANKILKKQSGRKPQRMFAQLERVDEATSGAIVITDEIIKMILSSHFFFGDLTGRNYGVVLETGIALALKPNKRVILFNQDGSTGLHFDLSVTNIRTYSENTLVKLLVKDLVKAAAAFEEEADEYIRFLSSQLTPDAIMLLNSYGRIWKSHKSRKLHPSIWEDSAAVIDPDRFDGAAGKIAFHEAVRELLQRRLCWTDYKPNSARNMDSYGLHATCLGWKVIEHIWHHDRKMRKPPNAPTGPNG